MVFWSFRPELQCKYMLIVDSDLLMMSHNSCISSFLCVHMYHVSYMFAVSLQGSSSRLRRTWYDDTLWFEASPLADASTRTTTNDTRVC